MAQHLANNVSGVIGRYLLMVGAIVCLTGLQAAQAVTATVGAPPPGRISNDIQGGRLVDTNPPGGAGNYPFGNWPAVIMQRNLFGDVLSVCSGEFLSRRFVLTAKHCIKGVAKVDIGVTRPGLTRLGQVPSIFFHVTDVYGYPGLPSATYNDIALLRLQESFDDLTGGVPIYHDNGIKVNGFAVLRGSSSSANEVRPTRPLYEGTAQLLARPPMFLGPNGGPVRNNGYFVGPVTANPPNGYPPAGMMECGDSGGFVGVYPVDALGHTTQEVRMVGVFRGGKANEEGIQYIGGATMVDSDALSWIGGFLGMIVSPSEGQLIPNHDDNHAIDVEVTRGQFEAVTRIELLNDRDQPEGDCTPVLTGNRLGCALLRPREEEPYADGPYRIRAYRGAAYSYDEVSIVISHQGRDLTVSGLAH